MFFLLTQWPYAALLSNIIMIPTTINVAPPVPTPPAGYYTSILAAIASLNGKILAAPVLINVTGSYLTPIIDLSSFQYPSFLTIQGNVQHPNKCVLTTTDSSYAIYIANPVGAGAVTFQGFTIAAAAGGTAYGIFLDHRGSITAATSSLNTA